MSTVYDYILEEITDAMELHREGLINTKYLVGMIEETIELYYNYKGGH